MNNPAQRALGCTEGEVVPHLGPIHLPKWNSHCGITLDAFTLPGMRDPAQGRRIPGLSVLGSKVHFITKTHQHLHLLTDLHQAVLCIQRKQLLFSQVI